MLDAGLAVVEIAAHGPHLHVVSGGGDHLLALDVAHAAIGEQHADGDAVYALETLQGGLASVAGGGHEDHELVIERSLLAQLLGAGREKVGQALQGHVLEGARRPVPQLQDVGALVQRGNGADGLIIEIVAIGAAHELVDGLVGQIDVERLVDGGRPLGVGETRQSADLVKAQRRQLFGNVETAALGQAVDDGLGERHRLAGCSTRVHVQVLAERGGPIDALRHESSFFKEVR